MNSFALYPLDRNPEPQKHLHNSLLSQNASKQRSAVVNHDILRTESLLYAIRFDQKVFITEHKGIGLTSCSAVDADVVDEGVGFSKGTPERYGVVKGWGDDDLKSNKDSFYLNVS